MWKKWALAAIVYLLVVMAGYGMYVWIAGPNDTPSQQMEM